MINTVNVFYNINVATVDHITSTVLSPELKTALLEYWNYAINYAARLNIVGQQPQAESE